MSSQKGRDFLLKIGDGADPEVFSTLGAARLVDMTINNEPVAATGMDGDGAQALQADAGIQAMEIAVEGLFRDAAAEEMLRLTAFNRTAKNYRLLFPNGDMYEAAFVVSRYQRAGSYDGLETFSATLLRTGAGTFS